MSMELFEGILRATKAEKGEEILESRAGASVASIKIAKDWIAALKDIIADKADAVKVIAEFEKRIDAEVAKGDFSGIYAHIRNQMPDTMDLGAIAANIDTVEKWLSQAGSLSKNEAKGDGASLTTATQNPSKVNAEITSPNIEKTSVKVKDPESLDALNNNEKGTVGDEIVEGYYMDDEGDVFYVYEDGNAFYVNEEGEPVEEAFCGNVYENEIIGERVEIDEGEVKEDYESDFGTDMTPDQRLDRIGDRLARMESRGEEDTPEYKSLDALFRKLDKRCESMDEIQPYEIFEDADGDIVYFNDAGDLIYATDEEIAQVLSEDVNIYYGNDGQGGVNVNQGGEGMPPQEDPNAQAQAQADAQPPQEPMQVELLNSGQNGEVNGVVIDVAGKHIEIGPDGVVNEQPAGGGGQAPVGNPAPQQEVQEGYNEAASNILKFFGENTHDYKEVKRRTPKTATGGAFHYKDPTDPKAVDALNSGGAIDGHKAIKEDAVEVEVGELFEDAGKWYYYDSNGELFEATEQEVQTAKKAANYDDVTIPLGLGRSITAVNEDKSATKSPVYESQFNYEGFVRAITGTQEAWKPLNEAV